MLVKEYRICMPMTVEEYRTAQLYMIQKKSREESTGRDSGVEIIKNEPYANGPGGHGQYTLKIYHIGSHLPGWLRSIIPNTALRVEEEAWNAYPYTKTRYQVPFIEKFSLEIETKYLDDGGTSDNVLEMSPKELESRIVDFIDIVTDPIAPSKPTEDPSTYVSEVTGRGPLSKDWRTAFQQAMQAGEKYTGQGTKPDRTGSIATESLPKHIMCSYKVCRVDFRYWGMQSKIENFIHDFALRRTMVNAHRQAWTWQDEWYGLTMTEIRRLEAEAARDLALKMGVADASSTSDHAFPTLVHTPESHSDSAPSYVVEQREPSQLPVSSIPYQNPLQQEEAKEGTHTRETNEESKEASAALIFGSCVSFASESERASIFQSLQDSDSDDGDFYDALCLENTPPAELSHQPNLLLFVVHGGCLQDKPADVSSKRADFLTFRSTLDAAIKNYFPGLRSRVIIHLISCSAISTDTLQSLNVLDPSILEPPIGGSDKSRIRSFIPLGNIPLLLTLSSHYPQDLQRLAQQLNEKYVEFQHSLDGSHFTGNVCIVADSIGSIMIHDVLAMPVFCYKEDEAFANFESDHCPSPSLLFSVQDVFLLGSPLGLLLSLRKKLKITPDQCYGLNDSAPSRPACEQVFNIFHLADPFAYRVEPLLDVAFERVPVVHLPAWSSQKPSQHQDLSECLAIPDDCQVKFCTVSSLPIVTDASTGIHSSSHRGSVSPRRSDWWGTQRIDLGLYCPESVQSILSRALPSLVHSSYWESKDTSYFIVWQLAKRLHCGESSTVVDDGDRASTPVNPRVKSGFDEQPVSEFYISSSTRAHSSTPSMTNVDHGSGLGNAVSVVGAGVGFTRQFRSSLSNRLRFMSRPSERIRTNNPNHRANDAIVLEGQSQVINARFTYGALDLSSLANEEVEIFWRPQTIICDNAAAWERIGSQTTDSNGRLSYVIPPDHCLPLGLHRLQLVPVSVETDDQPVELTLAVVHPGCDVVICSIDGSFAASLSLMGKDPKVRAGSVDIMRHWHSLGYLLVYMSARPDMQHRQVTTWLGQHNFPPGLTFFLDGIFTDPLRQKAILLKSLVNQNKLSVHCAYGSAKDIPIYRSLGLQTHQIFAVGKISRRLAQEATPIRGGYAAHFKELMDQKLLSIPATGPMSSAVLRNSVELMSGARSDAFSPQRSVFFDLPNSGDGGYVLPD